MVTPDARRRTDRSDLRGPLSPPSPSYIRMAIITSQVFIHTARGLRPDSSAIERTKARKRSG
jgi:hypothetical protein